jgi:hypothetical protein
LVTEDLAVVHDRQITPATVVSLLALGAVLLSGCATIRGNSWRAPILVPPHSAGDRDYGGGGAALSEAYYAEAVRLDSAGSPVAVDKYLQAAVAAWPAVEEIAEVVQFNKLNGNSVLYSGVHNCREWELYQSSVVGLLIAAQKFGR